MARFHGWTCLRMGNPEFLLPAPMLGPPNYASSDRKRYSAIWSTVDPLLLALLNEWNSRKILLTLSKAVVLWKMSSWLGNSCSIQVIPITSKLDWFFSGKLFYLFEFSGCRTDYCFFSSGMFVERLAESSKGWIEDVCLVCERGQGTQSKHYFC